jgi:hypothetical protein
VRALFNSDPGNGITIEDEHEPERSTRKRNRPEQEHDATDGTDEEDEENDDSRPMEELDRVEREAAAVRPISSVRRRQMTR